MRDDLTDDELERYARHVILEEVGEEGQIKLLDSKVLVVGAGGLGAPVLMYLAAAGIGTLGIVDHDVVDLSNLQRQIIHSVDDIGRPKTRSAAERLETINPDITIIEHRTRLTANNAAELFADYDLIVDGQLSTFKAYDGGPCYRCLFPEPPDPDMVPRCDTVGIFGAVAGVMGSLQATEVLKELLGLGTSMSGQLLLFDALDQTFRKIKVPKDPDCPTCGG
jgi:adenylyltransferase/sulfurtransferase